MKNIFIRDVTGAEYSKSSAAEPETHLNNSNSDVFKEPRIKKKRLSADTEETSAVNKEKEENSVDKTQNNIVNRKYEIALSDKE